MLEFSKAGKTLDPRLSTCSHTEAMNISIHQGTILQQVDNQVSCSVSTSSLTDTMNMANLKRQNNAKSGAEITYAVHKLLLNKVTLSEYISLTYGFS